MTRTPEQQREWEQRMAAAWERHNLPVIACEACGALCSSDGECLLRCQEQPVRPAVTMAMVLGLVMVAAH